MFETTKSRANGEKASACGVTCGVTCGVRGRENYHRPDCFNDLALEMICINEGGGEVNGVGEHGVLGEKVYINTK